MSVIYIDSIQEQVTAGYVTIYTAPSTADFESAHIVYANCVNESATNTELTLHIVQSTFSAAVSNIYFPSKTIFAGKTDPLTSIVGAILKAGDFISSIGSLAGNLNLKLAIKEIYT